jgi:hypothetical protein
LASFADDQRGERDRPLELPDTSPIDQRAERPVTDFAGKTATVRHLFETHSGDGRFLERN